MRKCQRDLKNLQYICLQKIEGGQRPETKSVKDYLRNHTNIVNVDKKSVFSLPADS